MLKYLVNYLIAIMMITTSILTFTSKRLRDDKALFIFAVAWLSIAIFYTLMSTKDWILHMKNLSTCDTKNKKNHLTK